MRKSSVPAIGVVATALVGLVHAGGAPGMRMDSRLRGNDGKKVLLLARRMVLLLAHRMRWMMSTLACAER